MQSINVRFWIEFVLCLLSCLGLALTLIFPNWIELIFGADPDNGDGTLEQLVVLGLLAGNALVMALLARRDLTRMQLAGRAS